jgi:hypothetical protein
MGDGDADEGSSAGASAVVRGEGIQNSEFRIQESEVQELQNW